MDCPIEEGPGFPMLGESSSSYAGRAIHGWRRNMWSSCVHQVSGGHYFSMEQDSFGSEYHGTDQRHAETGS